MKEHVVSGFNPSRAVILMSRIGVAYSGQNSQKAGHNSLISLFRDEYSYSGVFGVADYESDICFPKNKMVDTK